MKGTLTVQIRDLRRMVGDAQGNYNAMPDGNLRDQWLAIRDQAQAELDAATAAWNERFG
jgi:hypothetical protein